MELSIIAAVAKNGVIGINGKLPWDFPEDLKRFKRLTLGNSVIMGHKTYNSIVDRLGRPLLDRYNIVLSRKESFELNVVEVCHSVEEAYRRAKNFGERAFVIGGAEVYGQFMLYAKKMFLTEVKRDYDGDARFPEFNNGTLEWEEIWREAHEEFDFVDYIRRYWSC